jgi:GTP cyclohydrolase II
MSEASIDLDEFALEQVSQSADSLVTPTVYSDVFKLIHLYGQYRYDLNRTVYADEMRLQSGLPYSLWHIQGSAQEKSAVAVVVGDPKELAERSKAGEDVLVRAHSACITSEVGESEDFQDWLRSSPIRDPSDGMFVGAVPDMECDCKEQRQEAQALIAMHGGAYVSLDQEGRGQSYWVKIVGRNIEKKYGYNTYRAYTEFMGIEPDVRKFGHIEKFLRETLNLERIVLLSNNDDKVDALSANDLKVERRDLIIPTLGNIAYLKAKRDRFGHHLPDDKELETLAHANSMDIEE